MQNMPLCFFGIVGAIALIVTLVLTTKLIAAFRREDTEVISKVVSRLIPFAVVTVVNGIGFGICLLITLLS